MVSWQCNDHEFPTQVYPRLATEAVTDISASGAVFHGSIRAMGRESVTDHGFIWSLQPDQPTEDSEKISLGVLFGGQSFSAHVQHGLIPNTTYYVKAFTATKDHMVYGGEVSFRAAGSLPPLIEKFTPREGSWGDTLTIEGKRYSNRTENVKVMFGSAEAKILSNSDSTIKCIIPSNLPDALMRFKVIVSGQETTSSEHFRFLAPVIESFSPSEGTFRDIVTIRGRNFSRTKLQNKVKFNEFFAEVVACSPTSISAVVPPALLYKENKLTVTVNLQMAEASEMFMMKAPEIVSVSPTAGVRGTTVTIEGRNFAPTSIGNTVKFGANEARVVSVSETQVQVLVPGGNYDSREAEVSITVAEQTDIAAETFSLEDLWIEKNNIPGEKIDWATAFAIGDKGYVGLGSPGSQSFWKYSPEENLWTPIAFFPGEGRNRATSFVIDGYAYVGGGARSTTLLNDFWRYDPGSDSWTQVADFPPGIADGVGLSLNGKGYVVENHRDDEFADLWEYDPATDAWTMLRDEGTTGDFIVDAGFVADNRLFIFPRYPGLSFYLHDILEFDVQSPGWILRGEANRAYDAHATGFSVAGKGYIIVEGRVKEYDPVSDVWTTLQGDHPVGRQAGNAFVIGDKVYFGFGHSGKTRINDFWELDLGYPR